MNFRLEDFFGVKVTPYDGEMMKQGALKSFTLYDAHLHFAPYA